MAAAIMTTTAVAAESPRSFAALPRTQPCIQRPAQRCRIPPPRGGREAGPTLRRRRRRRWSRMEGQPGQHIKLVWFWCSSKYHSHSHELPRSHRSGRCNDARAAGVAAQLSLSARQGRPCVRADVSRGHERRRRRYVEHDISLQKAHAVRYVLFVCSDRAQPAQIQLKCVWIELELCWSEKAAPSAAQDPPGF